jgi:hypothetical protein
MYVAIGTGPLGLKIVDSLKKEATSPDSVFVYALCLEGEEGNTPVSLIEPIELVRLKPLPASVPLDPVAVDPLSGGLRYWWNEHGSPHMHRFIMRLSTSLDQRKVSGVSPGFDFIILIDLSSPTALLAPPILENLIASWEEPVLSQQSARWWICLLRPKEGSPYVSPTIEEMRKIQSNLGPSLHLFLLEDSAEHPGYLSALLRVWIQEVVSGHHTPPLPQEGLNTFGLIQRSLPAEPFSRCLEAHLLLYTLNELGQERLSSLSFRVPAFLQPVALPVDAVPWPSGELAEPLKGKEHLAQVLQPGEREEPDDDLYNYRGLSRRAKRIHDEDLPLLQHWMSEEAERQRNALIEGFQTESRNVLPKGGLPGAKKWLENALSAVEAKLRKADDQVRSLRDPNRRLPPIHPTSALEEAAYFLSVGLIAALLFSATVVWPLQSLPPGSLMLVGIGLWVPFLFVPLVLLLSLMVLRIQKERLTLSLRSAYPEWISGVSVLGEIFMFSIIWRFLFSEVLSDHQWLLLLYALWLIALTVLWFFWAPFSRNELIVVRRPSRLSISVAEAEKRISQEEGAVPVGRLLGRWALFCFFAFWIILWLALIYRQDVYRGFLVGFGEAFSEFLKGLLLSGNPLEALVGTLGEFVRHGFPWLRHGLLLTLVLSTKYPLESLFALWRREMKGQARPPRASLRWQTFAFSILAVGIGLFFWIGLPSDPETESLRRLIICFVTVWGIAYFWWNSENDIRRARALLEDWRELTEREIWLNLHLFGWESVTEILNSLRAHIERLKSHIEELERERIALREQAQREEREAWEASRASPGYPVGFIPVSDKEWKEWIARILPALMREDMVRGWFADLLRENIHWLRERVVEQVRSEGTRRQIERELNILTYLEKLSGAQTEREWWEFFSRWNDPVFSSWIKLLDEGSRPRLDLKGGESYVYLGLPPEAQQKIALQQSIGIILGKALTVFPGAPWDITVIRYHIGASAYLRQEDDLRKAEAARRQWEQESRV